MGVGRGRWTGVGGWRVLSGAPQRQYRWSGGLVRPHARQCPVPVEEPGGGIGGWTLGPVIAMVAGGWNGRRRAVAPTGGSRGTRPDRGPRSLTTVGIRRAVAVGAGGSDAAGRRDDGGRGG